VFWSWFHYGCAIVILLAVLFIVVTHMGFDKSLLVGESVAVAAFGVSRTAKGSELFKWLKTTTWRAVQVAEDDHLAHDVTAHGRSGRPLTDGLDGLLRRTPSSTPPG